jgi:hypothetical protein
MRKVNLGYAKGQGAWAETEDIARKSQRAKVETLISQLRSLPGLDERSAEEILGYGERGLF